jgi:hypothetical protein
MTVITQRQVEDQLELNRIADAAAETIVDTATAWDHEGINDGIALAAESFLVWLDAQMDTNYFLPGEINTVLTRVRDALNFRLEREYWARWNEDAPEGNGMEPRISKTDPATVVFVEESDQAV